ncbi:DNA cytosine methyltransferase [Streptacidiphilus neutrinimicus]|uniref:DNA cytosine methyltransferase n=1 Tax=Streptacidiphilus neutrinimicus TaxID=105420 RepID=UPI0005A62F82|nr:DNA cytosine methyltransferase [Streptacidiphilus neutrinimicus]
MARPITVIDLFAGCGGMSRGFKDAAGYQPVMAVEWDLSAAATYEANFGKGHMRWGDIAEIKDEEIPDADVIIGGPPCQGFSNLGSRDVNDPRNKLWKQYIRFVLQARPMVFVIENVDRFIGSSEFALLRQETQPGGLLEEYTLSHSLLLATDFGAPQRRKRAIVIGSRIGRIGMPFATHEPSELLGLKPWRTVRDAIADLPPVPATTELPDHREEFFGKQVPGIFNSSHLHLGRTPTALSLERYHHIPPGGGRFDLPDHLLPRCWREKKSGTTDVMGRMRWDRPSLTIRTEFFKPEKGQYLHPQWDPSNQENSINRPITHREAARLQTFPDDFVWCGSKIDIAKQIGNAVPPILAEAIARHIKPYIQRALRPRRSPGAAEEAASDAA